MIEKIRNTSPKILAVGNHSPIIQSIIDFDYAAGKETPSVTGIISGNKKTQKFFWGESEVLIPVHQDINKAKEAGLEAHALLNCTSAGSNSRITELFFTTYPKALAAHLFAENISELDSLSLIQAFGCDSRDTKLMAGASGVGLCIPSVLKLGAIGGITGNQVYRLGQEIGSVAIICSSGGMVNELIFQVLQSGHGISFAISYGGDRFPLTSPFEWILEAEKDPQTEHILFFGELGGKDEYTICDAIIDKKITKPVYAYIAGHYESEDTKIQFGHAKALANEESETAQEKMNALRNVGVTVANTFRDFMSIIDTLSNKIETSKQIQTLTPVHTLSRKTLFSAPHQPKKSEGGTFTEAILKRLLMKERVSNETVLFADMIFQELIDHGPNVSGAVNTMVTARAGRDLSSALASGILTIGNRFGGAINESAQIWFTSVQENLSPESVVKDASKNRAVIPGIGHLKYSVYKQDPRVQKLIEIADQHLTKKTHLVFAQQVAIMTTQKKQNLILNVDGAIAALMIDYLVEKENINHNDIQKLIEIEFFNSLFILSRTIGFIGNYLDQKRIDEGLFRLNDDDIHFF